MSLIDSCDDQLPIFYFAFQERKRFFFSSGIYEGIELMYIIILYSENSGLFQKEVEDSGGKGNFHEGD